MQLSRRAASIQASAIRMLDAVVLATPGVRFHRLNIGQPDVPTPKAVLEALATDTGPVLAYGPASGLPSCREAAAEYHSRVSPGIERQHVVVTQGGSEALLFSMLATCDQGDEILVPEPYYTNYNGFATVAGTRIVPVRTRLDDGFAIPPDAELDKLVTERTRMFLLSNPANPTGAVYSREVLERLARWARERGLWLVVDEVYRSIWLDEPPPTALELKDHEDHVIVVDSTSKTFSACGLRIGFLVSRNTELMERVDRLGQARLGPQPRAQMAAVAALSLPSSWYEEVRAIYRGRIDAILEALGEIPDVSFHRPEGAFYTMARLPVQDSVAFARWLVERFRYDGESGPETVVVAPGSGFYADPRNGRDEVRLAAVLEEERLRYAVRVLGEGLAAYRAAHPA